MTSPVVTLRIDYSGAPFGSAFTWTDFTSYLMAREGVKITWGRQDEQSECAPRTCSFLLSNPSGLFSPGDPLFPATFPPTFGGIGWDIGTPVNVRLVEPEFGSQVDRFTGYVDSIEPTWPGGVQSWSVVRVNCTDVSAVLGTRRPLRSMAVQEMLADSPTYLYALDEPSESGSAGDLSANKNHAAARQDGKYGAGTLDFGADLGLPDGATGVSFGPASSTVGTCSTLKIPTSIPASGAFTLELVFIPPSSPPAYDQVIQYIGSDNYNRGYVIAYIEATTGHLQVQYVDFDGTSAGVQVNSVCNGQPHHVLTNLNAARTLMELYFDGAFVNNSVPTKALVLAGFTNNYLGGRIARSPFVGNQFVGTLALCALYPTALTATRALVHYQAATGTLIERSDERYARLCGYAGLTPIANSDTMMGSQSTAGRTLVDALNTVARTENAPSFVTGGGDFQLQSRRGRYNATPLFTLTASDIRTPTVRRDRLGVANQVTVTRNGGASQFVADATSQATPLGVCDGGSFDVAPMTDEDALNLAAWKVAIGKTPQTRIPSLTVPLHSSAAGLVSECLLAGVGTMIRVTGLPVTSPFAQADLFIEGGSEVISLAGWEIEFFTSQNLPAVWSCAPGASRMDGSARVTL